MAATTKDKHRALIEGLYAQTLNKKLNWSPSIVWDGFDVDLAGRTVNINSTKGEYSSDDIVVTIFNAELKVVDTIADFDISVNGEPPSGYDFSSHYDLMEELVRLVRRQARGADDAVNDILSALGARV